jgi:hypothetical protein
MSCIGLGKGAGGLTLEAVVAEAHGLWWSSGGGENKALNAPGPGRLANEDYATSPKAAESLKARPRQPRPPKGIQALGT